MVATTVDSRTLNGSVATIDENGAIGGLSEPVNIADIRSLIWDRKPVVTTSSVKVFMVGGGILDGDFVSVSDDQLSIQSQSQERKFPLQLVRGIALKKSEIDKVFERALKEPSKENDTVIVEVESGARAVSGLLESIDRQEVGLNYEGKSRAIGIEKVRGIVMANLGFTPAKGPQATLSMVDGSRWVGVIQSLKEGQFILQLTKQSAVEVPLESVMEISIFSDRLRYLSDMVPMDVRESSQFTVDRSFQLNRSVGGNPMRMLSANGKSKTYSKGIGVKASSELSFANDNDFDRLRALVGIDLETNGHGDCDAIIRGDGIELWKGRVVASAEPQVVDVDITGIKKITLVVNPGNEFDLADHLNWGEIRFLKTKN